MRIRLAVAALASLALVTAVAPDVTAAPSTTRLVDCDGSTLLLKPTSFTLTCADGNSFLTSLRWSQWTPGTAKATGTLVTNDCTPNCAAGKPVRTVATVLLTRPQADHGTRVFSTITVRSTSGGHPSTEVSGAPSLRP